MSRSVRNPVPASVPIVDRLDRADPGLVVVVTRNACVAVSPPGSWAVTVTVARPGAPR